MTTRTRQFALVATVLLACALTTTAAGAAPPPTVRHCHTSVIGETADGTAILAPIVCGDGLVSLLGASTVHYVGANGTGNSLGISNSCGGAFVNLPNAWDNVVSSTWSVCTVVHYDSDNGSGASEATPPGATWNLTSLDNRAESAFYY